MPDARAQDDDPSAEQQEDPRALPSAEELLGSDSPEDEEPADEDEASDDDQDPAAEDEAPDDDQDPADEDEASDDNQEPEDGEAPAESEALAVVERPVEQFTIVEVRVPGIILTRDMPGYYDEETLFVPLRMFVDILEFPIDVDVEQGRAEGWFLSEDRSFELDLRRQTLIIGEQQQPLEPGRVERHLDDLYVDINALSEWFSIDYEFTYSLLRVDLQPEEPLPVQKRLERARRQASLERRDLEEAPRYQVVPSPYRLWSKPVHDLRLEGTLPTREYMRENPGARRSVPESNSYHLRGAGDMLYMNGFWSLSGSEVHPISRARLRFERKDPGGELLGDLQATEVAAGDIVSPSTPLVSRSSPGRGVEVSSFPLSRPMAFDYTTISGPMETGWEAELYRNDVLIDFQSQPQDDQYRFEEVPVLYGTNELRVVLYGPHGEEREESHVLYVGQGMITPGEHNYRVAVSQHNTEMVPIGSAKRDTAVDGHARASIEYERGIYEQLAVAGRVNTLPFHDGRQLFYATAGVRNTFKKAYTSVEVTGGSGWAMQGAMQARMWDLNLMADSAQFFSDFVSERFPNPAYNVKNRSRLRLNGVAPTGLDFRIPFSVTLENDYLGDGMHRTRLANRLSARLLGVSLVHSLRLHGQPSQPLFVNGTVSARRRSRKVSPLVETTYSAREGFHLYRLGAEWRITGDLNARGDLAHEFFPWHDLTLRSGLNHRLERFSWGANVGFSVQGGFSVGVNLTTAIGHNPQQDRWQFSSHSLTSTGTVVPRVFWDKDQDGAFDEDADEPTPEARFRINNVRRREHQTDEAGVAVFPDVPANDFIDIELERRSLYDPFFVPRPEGHSVVTRPGTVTYLDFPIVMTGEIDGTVWIVKDGMSRPAASVDIQLIDADGNIVQTTTTAFDGFYLLDFIEPGTYTVRIAPEQLGRMRLESTDLQPMEIGVEGTILSGQDFELRRPETD